METPPANALAFCRLVCTGREDAARTMLDTQPELTRHSVHAAAVWGDVASLDAQLHDDASRLSEKLGWLGPPLLYLCLSHRARPDAESAADVVRCAQVLVRRGADVRASVPDDELPGGRMTALAAAAGVVANVTLCRVLLEAGAPVDDGAALFVAAAGPHADCVQLLREHGADLDATDDAGRFTPLHWVLHWRYTREALDFILAAGVNPNTPVGALGETPLHVAVRRRRVDTLEPLRAAGADLDARTTGGMTAYRHAVRRPFPDVVRKLAEMGADTATTAGDALAVALHEQRLDDARAMLRDDSNLVPSNVPEEARLLPDLASSGKVNAVRLLLDHGVDIAARGLDGGTPLHQAAWFGQPKTARLLVERGAPLDVRGDDHDCTPLGWVAHGSRFSGGAANRSAAYAEVAEILLQAGAPFPQAHETHDRFQFGQATEPVAEVLRRFGWNEPPLEC